MLYVLCCKEFTFKTRSNNKHCSESYYIVQINIIYDFNY